MSDQTNTPAPRSGPNCLKSMGIGCLVIIAVLLAISFIPGPQKMLGAAALAAQCQLNLYNPDNNQNISEALDRYVTKNGSYPDKLEDLYPEFLTDKRVLHCPADPRPQNVVSYDYNKPSMDAPDDTIIIKCKRHVIFKGKPNPIIVLRKNGKARLENPPLNTPTLKP